MGEHNPMSMPVATPVVYRLCEFYCNLKVTLKPKFHYADFVEGGSRRDGIWAKGDVTGLSRTSRGSRPSRIWT